MWIVIGILIITIAILVWLLIQKKELDQLTADQNSLLQKQNEALKEQAQSLTKENEILEHEYEVLKDLNSALDTDIKTNDFKIAELNKQIDDKKDQLNYFDKLIDDNKDISQQAFSAYFTTLEDQYNKIENDFDAKVKKLQNHIQQEEDELNKLKATRAAAHEAMLREQEVKDNKDAYRLIPSASDLADSRRLELVKRELNKPRILCMLIWQTYWQPLAKKQFPFILQDKTKCGIYKITNLVTDECYIGQSVDVYKRWNDHCKCGLGIDTPPGNKLYKAMQEYGLDNFTFELLTECNQTELNEKEKYFIELYQADTFGFNSTGGNK